MKLRKLRVCVGMCVCNISVCVKAFSNPQKYFPTIFQHYSAYDNVADDEAENDVGDDDDGDNHENVVV